MFYNNISFRHNIWKEKSKTTKFHMTYGNNNGWVTVCEGSKVNYADVTEWFLKLNNDYEISTAFVGFDPWNSNYWITEMKSVRF